MTGSIRAELLVLRKRPSTWILLGIWTALALVFAYVVPYAHVSATTRSSSRSRELLPQAVVGNVADRLPVLRRRLRAHARRARCSAASTAGAR